MTPRVAVPEIEELIAGADHVDTKTVTTTASLREFVAGALSWQPAWMRLLWRARQVFAVALRLRETGVPGTVTLRPEDISLAPGARISFFSVTAGEEDRYLVMAASDNHLRAYLAIVAEPSANLMHAITIVRQRNWTGRLYWAVVAPFHQVVIRGMIGAGARPRPNG